MTEAIEKNEAVETEAASENKKPYTVRKLSSDDIFLMFAILGKIGVKELKHAFSGDALELLIQSFKQSGESDNAKVLTAVGVNVGFDAVDMILNNLPKCKEEIYQMLSNCSVLFVLLLHVVYRYNIPYTRPSKKVGSKEKHQEEEIIILNFFIYRSTTIDIVYLYVVLFFVEVRKVPCTLVQAVKTAIAHIIS